jgi:GWxTD domain-containing protein
MVPGRYDSLVARADAYCLPLDRAVQLTGRLIAAFPDTLGAAPPGAFSFRPLGAGPDLFEERRLDTLLLLGTSFVPDLVKTPLAFHLPPRPQGLYFMEFVVSIADSVPGLAPLIVRKQRAFGGAGYGFPRPTTIEDLVAPLGYIADAEEMKSMRGAGTVAEQRRLFEEFWLSRGKEKAEAANLIGRYYGRVEEANRLFTSHKPGWQTDRGMIYIVLGPPESIERRIDAETWNYPSGARVGGRIQFRRVANTGKVASFVNYVLTRSPSFAFWWSRTVARWRSGEVF